MTQSLQCTLYYSIPGATFDAQQKTDKETIARTQVTLNLYSVNEEDDELSTAKQVQASSPKTELSIAHDIDSEQFFSAKTWCMLENEDQQLLTINGQQLFPIALYRNLDKPEKLKIKFEEGPYLYAAIWE